MTDIKTIIEGIDKLKPIPQIANKIMSLAEDPKSSISDISELIIYDQALTANLLRICNSAYFRLPEEIDSVPEAIGYLGMDEVVDLVLMGGSYESLRGRHEGYELDEGELWRNSVSSAFIARELAEMKGSKHNHLIFTGALLKDIGKVILSEYLSEFFEKITLLVSRHDFNFKEAEKAVIGLDHAELGSMVAEKWKLSSKMVDIIRNHHLSEESSRYDFETSIVYLADTLCMMMGIGVGSDGLSYRFHREVVDRLNFSEKEIRGIMARFGEKLQHVEDLTSLS
jgi:putative nucleotidyltransferase with HDIG domain